MNAIAKTIACATTYFCDVESGGSCAPVDAGVPAAPTGCDTSRTTGPLPSGLCCNRVASAALLPGFVVPNAQMRFCDVPGWVCKTGSVAKTAPEKRVQGS